MRKCLMAYYGNIIPGVLQLGLGNFLNWVPNTKIELGKAMTANMRLVHTIGALASSWFRNIQRLLQLLWWSDHGYKSIQQSNRDPKLNGFTSSALLMGQDVNECDNNHQVIKSQVSSSPYHTRNEEKVFATNIDIKHG
eukprot:NODE_4_length_55019_cov_0.425091.p36 type:complete len:138 gc:universal NODE_4_length_55019_cov_0.425091:5044-5457(+)